jgi:hypothetical protein
MIGWLTRANMPRLSLQIEQAHSQRTRLPEYWVSTRICAALGVLVLYASSVLIPATALGAAPYWQQVFPELPDPPGTVRLKARTRATIGNLEALAAAGFGGAEVGVDFQAAPDVAQHDAHSLLEAATRLGIRIDWAPGGSQPYVSAGISEADSMQELVADHLEIAGGQLYRGAIRQPARLAGQARLVAVTAALVADDSGTPVILDASTAVDLTARLDRSGVLHWQVPPGRWLLFSFWQRATGQVMERNPFQDPSDWNARIPQLQPGQHYTADLFSSAGIASALAYLDRTSLSGDRTLLAGSDIAHDSLEVQAETFWTGDLPAQFRRRRGYSLIPFLPVLYIPREASFNPLDPRWGGPFLPAAFDFAGDLGARVRYDYRETLTDLYSERYLRTLTDWAHARGMQSRVEVAYNYIALDMLRSARAVDIPENESFDPGWAMPFDPTVPAYGSDRWRHAIDTYRMTGAGLHLAGRTRATIEFGDDFAIYRKQPVDYAQQLNESYAGGITMGLMTGFSSDSTAWPQPQGIAMLGLGDDWTSGWPQWRDWPALARYFARSTQVLESGQARVDVTVYRDRGLATIHESAPLFASDRLEGAGYTYDFIDPSALVTIDAAAKPGMLYGRSVGYRALILNLQATIPAQAARAIVKLARGGLAVVIIGTPPQGSTGFKDRATQDAAVARSMAELIRLPSVARIETADETPTALQRLGCLPSASFGERSAVLSVHRQAQGHDLWWLFNPTDTVISTHARFAAVGAPHVLDLWSGRGEPVAQWTAYRGYTQIPLVLMPHATTVVMIQHDQAPLHVTSSTATELWQRGDEWVVINSPGGQQRISLSDGRSKVLDVTGLPPILDFTNWHLQVDEVLPDGTRHHDLGMVPLADWRAIPELHDAVGSAQYSTSITLPSSWFGADRDALLTVGSVAGAMQLSINGQVVTEQSTGDGRWLVRTFLKPGDNVVSVRLDTTLLNRMAALRAAGDPRYQTGPTPLPPAPSGLIGPVTLSSVARMSP